MSSETFPKNLSDPLSSSPTDSVASPNAHLPGVLANGSRFGRTDWSGSVFNGGRDDVRPMRQASRDSDDGGTDAEAERIERPSRREAAQVVDEAVRARRDNDADGRVPELPEVGAWWCDHPAYQPLIESFGRGVNNREHLAYLTLVGLRRQGWDVVKVGQS